MSKGLKITLAVFLLIIGIVSVSILYLPVNRVRISSELIMLGDLNHDNRWDALDLKALDALLENPFLQSRLKQFKTDINQNGLLDDEDIVFLRHLCHYQDPYKAEQNALGHNFPKPRELYRYLPKSEYIQSPLFAIRHEILRRAPFKFLNQVPMDRRTSPYSTELLKEIYSEAVRFSFAFELRKDKLTGMERHYVRNKIRVCERLYNDKRYYKLLLCLIGLVEDAETLSTTEQSDFIRNILYFRDHLKALLVSEAYASFNKGEATYSDVFKIVEAHLQTDLNMVLDLKALSPPRDFTDLKNYLDRAEWQAHKSKTTQEEFKDWFYLPNMIGVICEPSPKPRPNWKMFNLKITICP